MQAIQAILYALNCRSILFPKYIPYTGFYSYEKFGEYRFKGIIYNIYPMLVRISNIQIVVSTRLSEVMFDSKHVVPMSNFLVSLTTLPLPPTIN